MKNFIASATVATVAAFTLPATAFAFDFIDANEARLVMNSDNTMTMCADEGRWGWKISGPSFNSNYTDWNANTAIGEVIGDGNCQDGWIMISDVDPRIMISNDTQLNNVDTTSDRVVNFTSTEVTTADAGRITASWQGFAPERLKGLPIADGGRGDKWKLMSTDGVNHTYKLIRQGTHPWPQGSTYVFTDQAIIDRDYLGGTSTKPNDAKWNDKLRYAASRDTTTVTQDYVTTTTRTRTYTGTRVFCPSVWTYTFVAPTGEIVASTQGPVGECQEKRYTFTRVNSFDRNGSTTTSTVGNKYVTPQN